MVEITDLTAEYQAGNQTVTALKDLNIKIVAGEIGTILGPSGSGKTTLLHIVAGIMKPQAGKVMMGGKPVTPNTVRIGFIPQNYGLLPWKTVYENILLGIVIKGVHRDEAYIHYIMDELGLAGLESRFPREISGGQQQRAAIARAFILRPEILLMDEPFSALDAITREEVQDLFLDLWRKEMVPTLFVTHSIEEAIYIGKRIILMSPSPGRVMDIIENPLFGRPRLRTDQAFYDLELFIRKRIGEGWCP